LNFVANRDGFSGGPNPPEARMIGAVVVGAHEKLDTKNAGVAIVPLLLEPIKEQNPKW